MRHLPIRVYCPKEPEIFNGDNYFIIRPVDTYDFPDIEARNYCIDFIEIKVVKQEGLAIQNTGKVYPFKMAIPRIISL